MDPTILQQLYLSKHTLKISSEYEIDDGALTEVGDRKIEYTYRPAIIRFMMTKPQISNIDYDLPIKICWDRWRFRLGHNEQVDYQYMAQQCINDPSTINFGFKFTNGPETVTTYRGMAQFEMDSNAHIVKIMPLSKEQVPCQTLDMIIQHIKDINVECEYFNKFWWTRRISGILECLGG